jgi:hypothetical protein
VKLTGAMQYYWLIVGILAVWRVSALLNSEAGPWDVLKRIRRRFAGTVLGSLVNCFYCLSVWVAAPFAFALNDTWKGRLLLWPALSAGAIIIERTVHRESYPPMPAYNEDQEESHVLRQEQNRQSIYVP